MLNTPNINHQTAITQTSSVTTHPKKTEEAKSANQDNSLKEEKYTATIYPDETAFRRNGRRDDKPACRQNRRRLVRLVFGL